MHSMRRRRTLKIGIPLILIISLGILFAQGSTRDKRFLKNAFSQFDGHGGNEQIETIHFPPGESLSVILEHACCSGAGFNAVAVRTSTGIDYQGFQRYCGVKGFVFAMEDYAFDSLTEALTHLESEGFVRK